MDFLVFAEKRPSLRSLSSQICWWMSLEIETMLMAKGDENFKAGNSSEADLFVYSTNSDAFDGEGMDYKLLQYSGALTEEAAGHDTFTIACDKANPSVMSLSNAIISFPNDVVGIMHPQVLGNKVN